MPAPMMVHHVSDVGSIDQFDPRTPSASHPSLSRPVVWAVDDEHLVNYLVPRDCPRVCFSRIASTTRDDDRRYLRGRDAVIAIDPAWLERVRSTALWVYDFEPKPFQSFDQNAGYFVAFESIKPVSRRCIALPINEIARRRVELRVVENLKELALAVADSSLAFSCIRMRNAERLPIKG